MSRRGGKRKVRDVVRGENDRKESESLQGKREQHKGHICVILSGILGFTTWKCFN